MYYRCESCGQELDRVIFQYDSAGDDLYLNCPCCGGNCAECYEEENEENEEDEDL